MNLIELHISFITLKGLGLFTVFCKELFGLLKEYFSSNLSNFCMESLVPKVLVKSPNMLVLSAESEALQLKEIKQLDGLMVLIEF